MAGEDLHAKNCCIDVTHHGAEFFRTEMDMAGQALVLANEERSSWDSRYRI